MLKIADYPGTCTDGMVRMATSTYLFEMVRITIVTSPDGTVGIIMVIYLDGIVRMAMVTYLDGMVRTVKVNNLCGMVRITIIIMVTYPDGGFSAETTVERLGSSLFLFSTI